MPMTDNDTITIPRSALLAVVDALAPNKPADARLNLSGAIYDITQARGKCDEVCLQTLKRVEDQLAEAQKAVLALLPEELQ